MPLTTETFDLEETLGGKRAEREDLAEQIAPLDPQNPAFESLAQQGNALDTHVAGLEWAIREWDVDAVTLSGLTGGEYAKLENEIQRDGTGPADARLVTIVHGTDDAPFVGAGEKETYVAVGQLPVAVQKWLEYEINELTSVGNSETTFARLVAEKRRQAAGTDS